MVKKAVITQLITLALVGNLTAKSGAAQAYDSGDLILRAGVASVQPDEDSSALVLNGVALAGTSAGVDNSQQLGLTLTYMLTPKWGVGVLAATPFHHDIRAKGLGIRAGDARQLPPTVTLQYFPLDASSPLQLYIGAGLNYTVFFSEDVSSQLGSGDLNLDDSFGLAGQIGADCAINKNWVLNASIWYLDIDTDATFKLDGVGRIKADVNIDPWVYMLGLGYRF
jgi:outer membrane protein